MATPISRWMIASTFLLAAALRFGALELRPPTGDEAHYRSDMAYTGEHLRNGTFREHSVRHSFSQAPHGLGAQLGSLVFARTLLELPTALLPANDQERDNLLSRFYYALCSLGMTWILWKFSSLLAGPQAGLATLALAAVSPLLINWGRSEYLDSPMSFFALLGLYWAWKARLQKPGLHLALAGLAFGVSLGAKWSAIVLLPFAPLAFLAAADLDHLLKPKKHDLLACILFIATFFGAALCFHSWESFAWALFPDPLDHYGDPGLEIGALAIMRHGLIQIFTVPSIGALALAWAGPLFLLLIFRSFKEKAPLVERWQKNPQFRFLALGSLGAFLFTLIQEGELQTWRGSFGCAWMMLLLGLQFSALPRQKLNLWLGAILVSGLPFALSWGLRTVQWGPRYSGEVYKLTTPFPDHPLYGDPIFRLSLKKIPW